MKNANKKQRIKIIIEYDGTNFSGWQSQQGKRCVQSELEKVLSSFYKEPIVVSGSGRTDAGVHALGQVAHFDASVKNNFQTENLPLAINSILPNDVKLLSAKVVKSSFDARKSVKEKTYLYKIKCSRFLMPLDKDRKMKVFPTPDIDLMKKASELLIGEHDYAGFMSSGSSVKTTVRTIYKIVIKKKNEDIEISITGNGFLYNMVRIIVGTLIEIGQGKRSPDSITEVLNTKNRKLAGKTASACGLYLKKIDY